MNLFQGREDKGCFRTESVEPTILFVLVKKKPLCSDDWVETIKQRTLS